MKKKFLSTAILLSIITVLPAYSLDNEMNKTTIQTPISTFNKENLKMIQENELTKDVFRLLTFSQPELTTYQQNNKINPIEKYEEANKKFVQGNITTAYKDYKEILNNCINDDFVNLGFAFKFANLGLFSLAQEAINNIVDRELYNNQINLIKSKLFPQVLLSYDDEIILAQNYTEIYYNNLAFEVAKDMSKNPQFKRSDYAHYVLSQAYYNAKDYNKAINEINKALSINPENINYLKYKAQILCETNKLNESLKIIDNLLLSNIDILDFQDNIKSLKYYTLAKVSKERSKTKYYLAKYFEKNNDKQRAIKELNQNILNNPKDDKSVSLLAKLYFEQNKLSEAMDLYEKAYKIKKTNPETLIGIADIYLFKKDYRNALNFYLKTLKKDKNNTLALIKVSLCYKNLEITDKSIEYANKALSQKNIDANVYYVASQINDIKNIQYLKKAISINPMFTDAWLDLAHIAIKNNRLDLAENYLKPVNYIDKNNYKYYYYLGIINKKQGNMTAAKTDFQKSVELNPFFVDASKELNSIN